MVGIGRKDFRAPASFLAGVGAEKKDGASKINFFFLAGFSVVYWVCV